jgi:hypothetical protein
LDLAQSSTHPASRIFQLQLQLLANAEHPDTLSLMRLSHQLSTLEDSEAITHTDSSVRDALIRYQGRLEAIRGDQGRVSDDSMWSSKDLERQKECQTLINELAKVQTKLT